MRSTNDRVDVVTLGGNADMQKSVAKSRPASRSWRIGEHEYAYIKQVLDSGFPGSSSVNFTGKFEAAFAEKFGCEYAITYTNGTATLHAALAACGVGEGDEVIVPPLTMASTSFAVLYTGARPVYADIDPRTLNIDPQSIRERITPRTKAIMPVAIYGLSPDMEAIMAIAREHHLKVVEDAAQCFLGRCNGKLVGTFGDLGSFSFQNTKHMTCGEGGILITNNLEYAQAVRRFSSVGYGLVNAKPGQSKIDKKALMNRYFKRHVSIGYNYRLPELCAAVLMAQLERLEEFVEWRCKSARAFEQVVAKCKWITSQFTPPGYDHTYWAYTAILSPDCDNDLWERFYAKFNELGGEGFYGAWCLTYLEQPFQQLGYRRGLCPVAEKLHPQLMQFKTNYGDMDVILRQADILEKTIRYFS